MKKKKHILIVDDEESMVNVLTLKFEHEGYNVSSARDGEEALKLLSSHHFDAMLLDLVMPKKDGFTVLDEMHHKDRSMHIVVWSNLGQPEDVQRAKKFGVDEYFVKTTTPLKELVDHINALLA